MDVHGQVPGVPLKQPKKPLTPYMRYSKSIWQSVKEVNPSLSVCEIGAQIGKMWRELSDSEKGKHNEAFSQEKIQYDEAIQQYLKLTGLSPGDLVKSKKKKEPKQQQHHQQHGHHRQPAATPPPNVGQATPLGIPTMAAPPSYPGNAAAAAAGMMAAAGALPPNFPGAAAVNSSSAAAAAVGSLPHFSQIWATSFEQAAQMNQLAMAGQAPQGLINTQAAAIPFFLAQQQQQHQQHQPQAGDGGQGQQQHQLGGQVSPMFNGAAAQQQHVLRGATASPRNSSPSNDVAAAAAAAQWAWQNPLPAHFLAHHAQQQQQSSEQSSEGMLVGSGDSHQQPVAGSPDELRHHQVATGAEMDNRQSPQGEGRPASAGGGGMRSSQGNSPHNMAASSAPGTPQHPGGQHAGGDPDQAPQPPSAHSNYNSYAGFSWANYLPAPGADPHHAAQNQSMAAALQQQHQGGAGSNGGNGGGEASSQEAGNGGQVVFNKESIQESELQHLRSALSEKTKEVQRLGQELEKAYALISQLRQEQQQAGPCSNGGQQQGAATHTM